MKVFAVRGNSGKQHRRENYVYGGKCGEMERHQPHNRGKEREELGTGVRIWTEVRK